MNNELEIIWKGAAAD